MSVIVETLKSEFLTTLDKIYIVISSRFFDIKFYPFSKRKKKDYRYIPSFFEKLLLKILTFLNLKIKVYSETELIYEEKLL